MIWTIFDHLPLGGVSLVFTCYLDDSYPNGGSVMTLAGYLALTENWQRYETESKRVYENYGIDELHTKRLFHRQKQFKSWSDSKCRDLVQDLFILARTLDIIGISYTIPQSTSAKMKSSHKSGAQLSPLGILFVTLCGGVTRNEGLKDFSGARDVSVVLEAGNKANAGIALNFNKQKAKAIDPNPRVKSVTLASKKDCRAIHLADFWAFFSRRATTKLIQDNFRQDDKLMERYFDPLAATACVRTRHTINLINGAPVPVPGQPDQIRITSEHCYEFGPPPTDSLISSLTGQSS
ncbi:MAG: hypothetical protein AAFX86_01760 [Pseudomonadota bacterium]